MPGVTSAQYPGVSVVFLCPVLWISACSPGVVSVFFHHISRSICQSYQRTLIVGITIIKNTGPPTLPKQVRDRLWRGSFLLWPVSSIASGISFNCYYPIAIKLLISNKNGNKITPALIQAHFTFHSCGCFLNFLKYFKYLSLCKSKK